MKYSASVDIVDEVTRDGPIMKGVLGKGLEEGRDHVGIWGRAF